MHRKKVPLCGAVIIRVGRGWRGPVARRKSRLTTESWPRPGAGPGWPVVLGFREAGTAPGGEACPKRLFCMGFVLVWRQRIVGLKVKYAWSSQQFALGRRLARRLLSVFVLAAFVPLLLASGLGYWYVSKLLVERTRATLEGRSQLQAEALMERLATLEESLRYLLARPDLADRPPLSDMTVQTPFSSVRPAEPDKLVPRLAQAGVDHARFREHLDAGKALLVPGAGQEAVLVMLGRDGRPWLGEVKPAFLQHRLDTGGGRLCLPWPAAGDVSCGRAEGVARALATVSAARPQATLLEFRTATGYRDQVHVAARLPLQARYLGPDWWVVSSVPAQNTLGLLAETRNLWVTVTVLVLGFVFVLSSVYLRRMLVPIHELLSGMQRFSRRDFSSEIEVEGSGEFSTLASHFNTMGRQLSRQFDIIRRLSDIDRMILSDPDILQVTEQVMLGVSTAFPGTPLSLCLRLNARSVDWLVGEYTGSGDGPMQLRWVNLDTIPDWLQGFTGKDVMTCEESPVMHRLARTVMGDEIGSRWWMAPMLVADTVLGVVMLADSHREPESLGVLREFADRLSVAVVNADRAGRLYRQAHYDDLTGLPNRQLMRDRLRWAIASAHRQARKIAVLFIDVDDFKKVNDSAGHWMGDQLLKKAAERMRVCVREGDTVARQGGDEFIVILPFLPDDARAQRVAERVVHMISSPFQMEGREFYVGASVGIALYPDDGQDEDALLMNADLAMYRAKQSGKNQFRFFEEQMQANSQERILIEKELRLGIRENHFILHYQPQWNEKTQSWSVEALARWNRPGAGIVSPMVFIGIAEETGLILEIGELLMIEACRQFLRWRDEGVALTRVAVNVSGKQLMRSDFVQRLADILSRTGLPPACLEIELTESVLLQDIEQAAQRLSEIKTLGIRIAIDDFGTGYSSLSYVQRLPIDVVKIDRSFISPLPGDTNTLNIVKAIIEMGHALGRTVVAEGVESLEQADLLLALGCDVLQGYHFSRPLPSDYCAHFVGEQNASHESPAPPQIS
jgi:diguanylate cyclase (GGDEF)-like protein